MDWIKIMHVSDLSEEQLHQVVEIDKKFYSEEFCVDSFDEIKGWYEKNPDVCICVLVDKRTEQVFAVMDAIPVEDSFFELLKKGEILDNAIPSSAIRKYDKPGFYKMQINDVAIDKNYQKSSVIKMILDCFFGKLLQLAEKDIYITEVVADCLTREGEKLSIAIGMKKLCDTKHGSSIYKTSLYPVPAVRPIISKVKEVIDVYNNKYYEVSTTEAGRAI